MGDQREGCKERLRSTKMSKIDTVHQGTQSPVQGHKNHVTHDLMRCGKEQERRKCLALLKKCFLNVFSNEKFSQMRRGLILELQEKWEFTKWKNGKESVRKKPTREEGHVQKHRGLEELSLLRTCLAIYGWNTGHFVTACGVCKHSKDKCFQKAKSNSMVGICLWSLGFISLA